MGRHVVSKELSKFLKFPELLELLSNLNEGVIHDFESILTEIVARRLLIVYFNIF